MPLLWLTWAFVTQTTERRQELTSWKMKGSGQSDEDPWNQTMYKGGGEGRGAAVEGWKDKFI